LQLFFFFLCRYPFLSLYNSFINKFKSFNSVPTLIVFGNFQHHLGFFQSFKGSDHMWLSNPGPSATSNANKSPNNKYYYSFFYVNPSL